MANELDILLRFLLDKANAEQGARSLAGDLKKVDESLSGKQLTAELERTIKKLKEADQVTKDTITNLKAEARVLNATASASLDGAQKATLGFTKVLAGQLEGVSKLSLATGTALVGGILGFANKYVANAKVATAETIAWKAAQDDLNRSGERIGAVLAKEALPLLKQVTELTKGAASFVETHPEAIRAALETGKILIGLGAIGLLVSKGVKLVADAKYLLTIPVQLEAARLQDRAAEKQLEAALLRAKDLGVDIPGGRGKAVGGASSILALAGAAGIGAVGEFKILQEGIALSVESGKRFQESLVRMGIISDDTAKKLDVSRDSLYDFAKTIPLIGSLFSQVKDEVNASLGGAGAKGGRSLISGTGGLASSDQFDAVLKAYEQYKQDDLAAVQKHYSDRKKIMADALASEQRSNAQYAASVAKVNAQRSSAVAEATRDFTQANIQAEQDYQNSRAQIIRDSGQEIQQIEADLQEQLRKSRREHEERSADLTASRDALGLAKERDRFQDEQSEAKREAKQEIQQRRQDIAQRLADLAQSYEQERAQRFAEYEARLAEIRAQAAAQLTELRIQHAAELREIQQNKIDRIKELDAAYIEERKRRYNQLIQNIRDLDASLLGEKNLKSKYQAAMLTDLDKFLASYKAGLGSLAAAVPGKADGGYTSGLVRTGERGYEYVMTHNTTRAAEALIGGRLTQQSLMAALGGAGNRQSVTWNDQRRFDGAYTNEIRRANRNDTLNLLGGLFT